MILMGFGVCRVHDVRGLESKVHGQTQETAFLFNGNKALGAQFVASFPAGTFVSGLGRVGWNDSPPAKEAGHSPHSSGGTEMA